jgi:hypothetical protein
MRRRSPYRDRSCVTRFRRSASGLSSTRLGKYRRKIIYWDAAIIEAARSLGCDIVYTEDFQQGRDFGGVRIVNPFYLIIPKSLTRERSRAIEGTYRPSPPSEMPVPPRRHPLFL